MLVKNTFPVSTLIIYCLSLGHSTVPTHSHDLQFGCLLPLACFPCSAFSTNADRMIFLSCKSEAIWLYKIVQRLPIVLKIKSKLLRLAYKTFQNWLPAFLSNITSSSYNLPFLGVLVHFLPHNRCLINASQMSMWIVWVNCYVPGNPLVLHFILRVKVLKIHKSYLYFTDEEN